MTAKKQNFEMFTGDSKQIVVTITNTDGTPVDLTGATLKWAMKKKVYGYNTNHTVFKDTASGGIVITDAAAGICTISLTSEDTAALPNGLYNHEMELTDAAGNVSTVMVGNVTLNMSGV